MPKFEVEFTQAMIRRGIVTIEAESSMDAQNAVEEMDADNPDIEWDPPTVADYARLKPTWCREISA